ncbi:UNKNOWN [Stylonychia lemnae]|uniref:Uncharacterized protein n=1 Tax=Stylonychia lemnae TaxID=5949 RepID=A0A078A8T3_STYLE|nr:UNKNOWN [Stylonychia lemnae]|eukprot:CDW78680.1 UNKNOWN [Stylonychia lemnae]
MKNTSISRPLLILVLFAILFIAQAQALTFKGVIDLVFMPFYGAYHGSADWINNQIALLLFQGLFHVCLIETFFFTFIFNDEGVAFYQCYSNFPKQVLFF